MSSAKAFIDAITNRRSIYQLTKNLPAGVTQQTVVDLVREAVKQTPSSFNNQSSRAVVLFGAEHDKLWDLIWSKLETQPFKDDAQKEATRKKNDNFKASAGTVLFFEDTAAVAKSQTAVPLFASYFPQWSEHTSGIAQSYVWTALSAAGVGASLQHYGNLIEQDVLKLWDLPETWVIKAQSPFGGIGAPAKPKTFAPIEERVRSFGQSQ